MEETRYQRVAREQHEREQQREILRKQNERAAKRNKRSRDVVTARIAEQRAADHVDGYDRDNLGLSPDF